jgi:hypothetical protein
VTAAVSDEDLAAAKAVNAAVTLSIYQTSLRVAVADDDLPAIAVWRNKTRELENLVTRELKLSGNFPLSVSEFARRADRALGTAIRAGQAAGVIRSQGQTGGPRNPYIRDGKLVNVPSKNRKGSDKISPSVFVRDGGQEVGDI